MHNLSEVMDAKGVGIDLPWYQEGQELRLLWHCGYWDGVLSGMCSIQGQRYWFECVHQDIRIETDDPEYPEDARLYAIVKLTDQEVAEEERVNGLFCKYVGAHCNYVYNEQGQAKYAGPMVSGWMQNGAAENPFYKQQKSWPKRNYLNNQVVGFWAEKGVTPDMVREYPNG